VPDVLAQLGHEIGPSFLFSRHRILRQAIPSRVLDVAEFTDGFASCVGFTHALLRQLPRPHVEVEAKLVIEVRSQTG
jgi:hypothetical protein